MGKPNHGGRKMRSLVLLLAALCIATPVSSQGVAAPATVKPESGKAFFPKGQVIWSKPIPEESSTLLFANDAAYLHEGVKYSKIDLATQKEIWTVAADANPMLVMGGSNGRIFQVTKERKLNCLEESTGKTLWSMNMDKLVEGGFGWGSLVVVRYPITKPVLVDDLVIFGTHGAKLFKGRTGKVYALEAATGKLRWEFEAEDGVENEIICKDNKLYFGGVAAAYSIDVKTGKQIWKQSLRNDNQWSFKLVDDTLLVSSGHYGSKGSMFGGTLYALNAKDGSQRWKFDIGGPSFVRVEDGMVVGVEWGSMGGTRISAVRMDTGSKVWDYKLKTAADPVVKNGRVVCLTRDEEIQTLDLKTGRMVSSFKAAGEFEMSWTTPWALYYAPMLIDGEVVVASWDDKKKETVFQKIDVDKGNSVESFSVKGRTRGTPLRFGGRMVFLTNHDKKTWNSVVME